MKVNCPNCQSSDVTFRSKKQCYICEDCNTEFVPEQQFKALRIFISYGHDEHASFAQKLVNDIKAKGHEVWFDLNRLKPGNDWENYIEEGLNWAAEKPGSGRIILIMTPHSVRRPDGYCLNEIARALDHHLFILPVMLVWCSPPLSISRIQWLDMQNCSTGSDAEGRYITTKNRLLEALENQNIDLEGQASLLRNNLNPLSFEADIFHYQKWFTGRDWVFREIEEWIRTPLASRLFWITGLPGVGKTAIATKLIQRMENLVAFHLCRRGNSEKASPRRAVMSIAFQLSTQLPDYAEKLAGTNLSQLLSDSNINAVALFDALLVQPFATDIQRPDSPRIILIDGLDEATSNGRNLLAEFISGEFKKLPDWLRIIITSRPDPEVTGPLQAWERWTLETNDPKNRKDLETYIKSMLDGISDDLLQVIIQNSEGIFLYAEWVCREINLGRLSLQSPQDFPKGLGGIYDEYFKQKLTHESSYKIDIQLYQKNIRPVFELIIAAKEPLTLNQISGWLDWNRYDEQSFFRKMGSLFFIDPNGCIRPFHTSVLDWLGDSLKAGDFFVYGSNGHHHLTFFLWNEYLKNGASGLSEYAVKYLPTHLIDTQRWAELEKLLCDFDFIRAKCSSIMVLDLVRDYSMAISHLPENQEQIRFDKIQSDRLRKYINDLFLWSQGEITEMEVIPSVETWTEERIQAERQQIIDNPSRLDIIKAFAQFVSLENANLVKYGNRQGFNIQQAFNFSDSGPVIKKVSEIVMNGRDLTLLFTKKNNRPVFNPYSALTRTLEGHTSNVVKVGLNGEGTKAVSASGDNSVKYWDLVTGECLKTFSGHLDFVNCASLSCDNKIIVSGSSDKTLRIWNALDGACTRILEGHTGDIEDVCISIDAKTAISASDDNTLRVWDLNSGFCRLILAGHTDDVLCVCISHDGSLAVSGSKDKTLRVWDMKNEKCLKILHGHTNSVKSVCMPHGNQTVISASYDKTIRIWDIRSGSCLNVLSGHSKQIEDISISADGKIAVSASMDTTLRIWEIKTGKCIKQVTGHTGWVHSVRVTPDGRMAISAGEDRTLKIWDIHHGMNIRNCDEHISSVYDVQYTQDGLNVVSAGKDKTIRIWNMLNGNCIKVLYGHKGVVSAISLTSDGKFIVSVSNDKTIRVWDIFIGECIRTFTGHTGWISFVAVTPDGKSIISGSIDETVRIWDFHTGGCRRILKGHTGRITGLCITFDNRKIISSGNDHLIVVWDLITGKKLKIIKDHTDSITVLKLLPDNNQVISASWDNSIRIWDINSGECIKIMQGHENGINDIAITADGKKAVSAGFYDNKLLVWNLVNGQKMIELEGHTDQVLAVKITPDGKQVVSGGKDKTLRIWNIITGHCVGIYPTSGAIYTISSVSEKGDIFFGLNSGKVIGITIHNSFQAIN